MANEKSDKYKHDASDKKLDESVNFDAMNQTEDRQSHDPDQIKLHNDTGKDRMFEGREQRDKFDLQSEKRRLAKDLERHEHATDGPGAVTPANMHVKRKN